MEIILAIKYILAAIAVNAAIEYVVPPTNCAIKEQVVIQLQDGTRKDIELSSPAVCKRVREMMVD